MVAFLAALRLESARVFRLDLVGLRFWMRFVSVVGLGENEALLSCAAYYTLVVAGQVLSVGQALSVELASMIAGMLEAPVGRRFRSPVLLRCLRFVYTALRFHAQPTANGGVDGLGWCGFL